MSRPPATSSTTWANEKIASFEPSVGITSRSGSSDDPEAAPDPARNRLAQLGQADRGRIAHSLAHTVPQRLDDARVGRLARVAHPEVDHLEPLGPPRRRRLVQPHERVRRLAGEDGGDGHDAQVVRKRCRVS